MRKNYRNVRLALERADPDSAGFLPVDLVCRIVNENCMPLTDQDFELISQQVERYSIHCAFHEEEPQIDVCRYMSRVYACYPPY